MYFGNQYLVIILAKLMTLEYLEISTSSHAPKHPNFSINLFKAIVLVIIAAPHVLRTVGAITSFFIISSYSSCRIEGRGGRKQQPNVLMTPRNNGT